MDCWKCLVGILSHFTHAQWGVGEEIERGREREREREREGDRGREGKREGVREGEKEGGRRERERESTLRIFIYQNIEHEVPHLYIKLIDKFTADTK